MARIDIEEIESTKSEKALAVVLAVFLLVGVGWAYVETDDWVRAAIDMPNFADEVAAVTRADRASAAASRARTSQARALRRLELAREEYRTALDAGAPAARLAARYQAAQATYARARERARERRAAADAARPAAERAADRRAREERRVERRRELLGFALRFVQVAGLLTLGLVLLARLRRRGSRYLPAAVSVVAAATVIALVLAGDYVTDFVDPLDLGPLLLSAFGVAATLGAFAVIQRYLARRIPTRRVRRSECVFCGHPVRDRGPHCERCGRDVIAPCSTCGEQRHVGTAHCAACGHA